MAQPQLPPTKNWRFELDFEGIGWLTIGCREMGLTLRDLGSILRAPTAGLLAAGGLDLFLAFSWPWLAETHWLALGLRSACFAAAYCAVVLTLDRSVQDFARRAARWLSDQVSQRLHGARVEC